MSADNCIAILKTTDKFKIVGPGHLKNLFGEGIIAYRVAHIQAHDNYEWYKDNEIHNLGCWFADLFKKSEVFYSKDEAAKRVVELLRKVDYVEYGIIDLDASEYNFPGC
jgi:hypothetical protein